MGRLLAKRIKMKRWIDNEIPKAAPREARSLNPYDQLWRQWRRLSTSSPHFLWVSMPMTGENLYVRWSDSAPLDDPEEDIAPWVRDFHSNANWLAKMHGSIEDAAVADALECDWPDLDGIDE